MARTREELTSWVQVRIDESGGQSAVLETSAITRELDEAARIVLSAAPRALIYPVSTRYVPNSYVSYLDSRLFSVIVPLPANYLRFLRIKLYEWTNPVDRLGNTGTQDYEKQVNPYTRAVVNRPYAAVIPLVHYGFTRAIECFPAPDSLTDYQVVNTSSIPPYPGTTIVASTELMGNLRPLMLDCIILTTRPGESVPEEGNLQDAMVWLAAARCLASLRVFEGAKHAMQAFQQIMPVEGKE